MKFTQRILTLLLAVGLAGCPDDWRPPWEPQPKPPTPGPKDPDVKFLRDLDPPKAIVNDPRLRYMVHMQIVIIEMPANVASGGEALWSHFDETDFLAAGATLSRNGMRIGKASAENWSAILKQLEAMKGMEKKVFNLQIHSAMPAPVTIKADNQTQTIFTYRNDQTLRGEDYPPGDNIFTTSCSLDPNDRTTIHLDFLPQIRSTRTEVVFVTDHGAPRQVSQHKYFPFLPLLTQTKIPSGDFLLVGPGLDARRPTSIGNHFFTMQKKGMPYETMLLIRPRVYRLPTKTPKATGPISPTATE
ncbi:MAG: hypothetical protein HN909_03445 [Phycisphaerales bacterium]|jgi:hypothetical protein|nr:hypothetical protein [Phycisphaerales bacterium]MBT7170807.1 hypothetical protein [Phycisphaerales bacterium]